MQARSRYAVVAGACFALGVAATCATRLAAADDAAFDGSLARNNVEGGGRAELSGNALEAVREALSSDEGDPTLHELVAFADAGAHRDPQAVTAHFMRSLDLRPVSGYTWAAFAADRYRAGDTGRAFEQALVNAAMLGPVEPPVQETVANLGLAVWNDAAPATRKAVESMVAAAMRRYPPEILQIAERRGRLDVACRHFDGFSRLANPKWIQPCNRLEATS